MPTSVTGGAEDAGGAVAATAAPKPERYFPAKYAALRCANSAHSSGS